MPLTWDLTDIADHETVCFIEEDEGLGEKKTRLNPVTEVLIFATMSVGLGTITEKNADEFYARIWLCERMFGHFMTKNGEPEYLTPEHIRVHIGLRCNVTEESRTKWINRTVKDEMKAAARRYRKDAEAKPEEPAPTEDQELAAAAARAEAEQAALVGATHESDDPEALEREEYRNEQAAAKQAAEKPNPFIGE